MMDSQQQRQVARSDDSIMLSVTFLERGFY